MKLILLLPLIILACGKPILPSLSEQSKTDNRTPGSEQQPEGGQTPPTTDNPKGAVCYQKNCFILADLNSIDGSDFVYPNPFNHPNFPNSQDPNNYVSPTRVLPLFDEDSSKQVSKNFNLGEFVSTAKGLFGVLQKKLVARIQKIRSKVKSKIHITSGYRSPGHNSRTPNAKLFSRHQYGDAIDFISNKVSLEELAKSCHQQDASFVQVYPSHIHCDWRLIPQDKHFFDSLKTPLKSKVNLYKKLSKKIVIFLKAESKRIIFKTRSVYNEDGDPLIYKWKITTPKNEVVFSSEQEPILNKISGKYKIEVTVGHTLTAQQEIIVN